MDGVDRIWGLLYDLDRGEESSHQADLPWPRAVCKLVRLYAAAR